MGKDYVGAAGSNPIEEAANFLTAAYYSLKSYVYSNLMSQTHIKDLYELIEIDYDINTETITTNFNNVITQIQSEIFADNTTEKDKLFEFASSIHHLGLIETSNYQNFYDTFASMGSEYKHILNVAGKVTIYGSDDIATPDNISSTAEDEAIFANNGDDFIHSRQ